MEFPWKEDLTNHCYAGDKRSNQEQLELDRTFYEEVKAKDHKSGTHVEPSGKTKRARPKNMRHDKWKRAQTAMPNTGWRGRKLDS